jgi:hypothetical protein
VILEIWTTEGTHWSQLYFSEVNSFIEIGIHYLTVRLENTVIVGLVENSSISIINKRFLFVSLLRKTLCNGDIFLDEFKEKYICQFNMKFKVQD